MMLVITPESLKLCRKCKHYTVIIILNIVQNINNNVFILILLDVLIN